MGASQSLTFAGSALVPRLNSDPFDPVDRTGTCRVTLKALSLLLHSRVPVGSEMGSAKYTRRSLNQQFGPKWKRYSLHDSEADGV
jgi:hypothetical protein